MLLALQRYMKSNGYTEKSLENELKVALKGIRFLTLCPEMIANSTLLTGDEVRVIISCLSEDSDISKMPTKFSVERKDRTKSRRPKFLRELNSLYADNFCSYCTRYNHTPVNHSVVHCTKWTNPMKAKLVKVHSKYSHCELYEYGADDIHFVYGVYTMFGWITQ